jgi:serine/threonine protein kinase
MLHDVDLLNDENFGAGKKPCLVQLSEDLLLPMTNQNRVNLLTGFGFVTSADKAVCNAMLDFSISEWETFASKLLTVEIVPGQPLLLDIDLTEIHQQRSRQLGVNGCTKRSGPAELSRVQVRFNRILGESQKNSGGFRLERYVPDAMVRDLPMMPSDSGIHSTLCSAMYVQNQERVAVVLKIRSNIHKDSDLATEHELSALKVLRSVVGVPKIQGVGIIDSGSVLVMRKESNDSSSLETLNVSGFFKTVISLLSTLDKIHAKGVIHLNLFPFNLLYDSVRGDLVIGSLQYSCRDPEADETTNQRCANLGFQAQSPLKAKFININHLDNGPKSKKYDHFCAGATILSLLQRNIQAFSARRTIDMSSLGKLSQQAIAALFANAIDYFNSFLDTKSEILGPDQASAIIRLGCGLLHADPERRYTCQAALHVIHEEASRMGPPRSLPDVIIVAVKLIGLIGEMQRATKIEVCYGCVDSQGCPVPGRGLYSYGGARLGDLLSVYSGQLHTKQQGDFLSAKGHGSNLKSIIVDGQSSVLDARYENNGFVDLFFLATHGAAGLANCNASIQVKRDGKGGSRIIMNRFPANAYFEKIILSQPYKLPVPGNHFSTELIVLRAARDLLDGEEILADYGPGTMKKMFGLCSGELIISKPVVTKRRAAEPKRQQKQQRVRL